jgi:hypothetical protein
MQGFDLGHGIVYVEDVVSYRNLLNEPFGQFYPPHVFPENSA